MTAPTTPPVPLGTQLTTMVHFSTVCSGPQLKVTQAHRAWYGVKQDVFRPHGLLWTDLGAMPTQRKEIPYFHDLVLERTRSALDAKLAGLIDKGITAETAEHEHLAGVDIEAARNLRILSEQVANRALIAGSDAFGKPLPEHASLSWSSRPGARFMVGLGALLATAGGGVFLYSLIHKQGREGWFIAAVFSAVVAMLGIGLTADASTPAHTTSDEEDPR